MKKNYILLLSFLFCHLLHSQGKLDVFDIARKGTVEQARQTIKDNPKAFSAVNAEGYSPLILACYRGNNEVARFLIDNGADLNYVSGMGTALMAAVAKGNAEITKYLLDKKADPNIADGNGTTALIYAAMFKNVELTKILLANNVDKLHKDKQGKTAFEYAVFSANQELINLLKTK